MPFCLAMTLIHRSIDPADFTNERLSEPLVQHLISCTHHVPDSPVVTVMLKDGTRITEPIQPHTNLKGWDAVSEKFQKSVAGCLNPDQQHKLLALVSRLNELPSAAELARNLCAG
jgi:hypothetical protein